METFNITLNSRRDPVNITVAPSDNEENSYSTYFHLEFSDSRCCDIFLDEDYAWKTCRGYELAKEDVDQIISMIEDHMYRGKSTEKSTFIGKIPLWASAARWFYRVKNALNNNKSAA